jgi:hypothetical protein
MDDDNFMFIRDYGNYFEKKAARSKVIPPVLKKQETLTERIGMDAKATTARTTKVKAGRIIFMK